MRMNEDRGTPSRSITRLGLLVGIPVAVVFGVQAFSWGAGQLKTWADRRTPTPAELNSNVVAVSRPAAAEASAWFPCGSLESLRLGAAFCEINGFPSSQYEYGFRYNTTEPVVADCLFWNRGLRVVNRHPYMIASDNPLDGRMGLGGPIFYTGTDAPDDDIGPGLNTCSGATPWRHHYWQILAGDVILHGGSNGCVDLPLLCRAR